MLRRDPTAFWLEEHLRPPRAPRRCNRAERYQGLQAVTTRQAGKAAVEQASRVILHEAGRCTSRSAATQAGKELAKRSVGQAAKSALRSNAITSAAFFLVDQGADTARYAAGTINAKEYKARSCENAGSAAGSLGGTAAGAAIGTAICPGLGTIIGGIIGGMTGGSGGGMLGRWFGG